MVARPRPQLAFVLAFSLNFYAMPLPLLCFVCAGEMCLFFIKKTFHFERSKFGSVSVSGLPAPVPVSVPVPRPGLAWLQAAAAVLCGSLGQASGLDWTEPDWTLLTVACSVLLRSGFCYLGATPLSSLRALCACLCRCVYLCVCVPPCVRSSIFWLQVNTHFIIQRKNAAKAARP